MRVLITGANGFVGRELVRCLLARGSLRGQPIGSLLVLDRDLQGLPDDARLRRHFGSVTDPALMRRVLADGIDVVFHLVSIPGGAAEEQYELGYQVNLLASLELLNQLRNNNQPPVLVYASSVAVYGGELPERMSEAAELRPELSYGTHKAMVESAVSDLARRGDVDGRALRLPGIVARPREPNGLRSAFMSDLMRAFAEGEPYQCPVSPRGDGLVDVGALLCEQPDPRCRAGWRRARGPAGVAAAGAAVVHRPGDRRTGRALWAGAPQADQFFARRRAASLVRAHAAAENPTSPRRRFQP